MAGNGRFESSSGSPEDSAFSGSYPNGQRGAYPSASLDRSGSFRESSSEGRMYSSGASTPRGSAALAGDLPPITEYVNLDPVKIENQKYTRLGELRRALGIISFGSTAEDNSFGAAHSKPAPAVATEELRRFKANVFDASNKAKKRMFDESLHKVNKYEALSLKKQQRNELIANERSGGLNFMKIGTQSSRNTAELVNQKLEDRTKNVVLNKRVRSSVAETRAEGQSNSLAKRTVIIGKDRDTLRECGEGSDIVDEKIRRLPVGGETWDRKMKRKRSVGPLIGRPLDDGEPKRAMHYKLNTESGSTSCDAPTFRSGLLNGSSKFDGPSLPASSNGRATSKNELEKGSLSRDSMSGLSKERSKGNNKINSREDNQMAGPNLVMKGKASRGPRSGPLTAGNLSPNFPRTSQSLEGWEQPASVNKIHSVGAINRSRPISAASPSPPMAQWVGQRPPKMSRTRRANLVPPVSNHDDVQISPEGCSPSDMGTRFSVLGTNETLSRGMPNGGQQFRVKIENVSSPTRLSESEESGVGENRESRLKEKGLASGEVEDRGANASPNTVPLSLHTKKSKINVKEEPGDSVRRQGRSGRGSSFPRVNTSPVMEKLETGASAKPLKSTRLGSERSGSKSGRPPLKKMSERKGVARLGHINAFGSPDFSGEQDDDHEELLEAATYACNFSSLACSSSFWKKMQPIFSPVSSEDISYFKEQLTQLKCMEINVESNSQMFGVFGAISNNYAHEENFASQAHISSGKGKRLKIQVGDLDAQGRGLDSEGKKPVVPLYQRVLSALIMEDEMEEFEEDGGARVMSFHGSREYSYGGDFEQRNLTRGPQVLEHVVDDFGYNDRGNLSKGISSPIHSFTDDVLSRDQGFTHLDNEFLAGVSENGVDGPLSICTNATGICSFDCPYEQLCMEDKLLLELQSIGIYPEIVPNLTDGDNEAITSDILGLQKGLSDDQVGKTQEQFKTIIKAVEDGNKIEKRCLEQVAMDRLVELSYKKLLATRGSYASKHGLAKVPKPVAMAFMKRTLARCRRYEETGRSCFSEPALRDVIYATPPSRNDPESTNCINSSINMPTGTKNSQQELRISGSLSNWADRHDHQIDRTGRNSLNGFGNFSHSSEQDFAKTGPILNRGKKKELLLDDVGGGPPLKVTSSFGNNLSGGAKGKRSERDRDKDLSSRNAKAGRLPNQKGDRKTKMKPKQKTGQLSTSGNVSINGTQPSSAGFGENSGNVSGNRKRENELVSHGNNPDNDSADLEEPIDFSSLPLTELDSIDAGVGNGLDDDWLNMDFSLQDHDSVGLAIPMDDLTELNMLM